MPKTIVVGQVKRSDTYTGRLAYIIYKDDKNVLRKEKSWNGWRNHKIPSGGLTGNTNSISSGIVLQENEMNSLDFYNVFIKFKYKTKSIR
jgi:hypothetical protein